MQDDRQNPQSGVPGVTPAEQPYTVEQPASAAPQTTFAPTQPDQPFGAAPSPAPTAPAPSFDQPQVFSPQPAAAFSTEAVPAAPAATPTTPWAPPAAPAAPVAPTAASGFIPGAANPFVQKRKFPIMPLAIVGGVLLLALAAFAVFKFVLNSITLEDVTTARTSYNNLSDNVYDASSAVRSLDTATTTAEFESKLKVFEAKLADAEKQYNALKDSPVQHNSKVHQKFEAFDKKWAPYVAFLKANVKDSQTLLPIQIEFEAKMDDLAASAPSSTAQLGAYLANFKTLVDDTSDELKNVKMSLDENQKMLESLQKFLGTTTDLISKAQSDLAAGASIYTVTGHIYDISSASYDMNDELYSLQNQLSDKGKLLDPASEFNEFGDSLSQLYSDMSK